MNIWIIDINSGTTLLYKAYINLHIDEDLVAGLLTALNSLAAFEFKQGIEAILMSGYIWVYVEDRDVNLLFIAAANKHEKAEMLRARLNIIRQAFIQEYVKEKDQWEKIWTGNITMFKPFKNTIDEYYQNWLAAESVTTIAEFYDILGIFQQLLFDLLAIVQNQINEPSRENILAKIEIMFENYVANEYVKNNPELSKISFSREAGINIITINPNNCDMLVLENQIINLMRRIVTTIREEVGFQESLNYFVQEGLFDYILNNISLLNQLNLDTFLLKLFLRE